MRNKKPELYFDFLAAVFAAQDDFLNAKTKTMTREEVMDIFASLAATEAFGFDKAEFVAGLEEWDFVGEAFKEAQFASLRGVVGSPKFAINGFVSDKFDSGSTVAEWTEALDAMLA